MKVLSLDLNVKNHGKRNTIAYKSWCAAKTRCFNKNVKDYKYYGGRGIKMTENWKSSFIEFYNYVSQLKGYKDEINKSDFANRLTLDRINSDKGYCIGNLRWVKFKNQAKNKRVYSNNKTGYVGVQYHKTKKTFCVYVNHDGKEDFVGNEKDLKKAVKIRNEFISNNNLSNKLQIYEHRP